MKSSALIHLKIITLFSSYTYIHIQITYRFFHIKSPIIGETFIFLYNRSAYSVYCTVYSIQCTVYSVVYSVHTLLRHFTVYSDGDSYSDTHIFIKSQCKSLFSSLNVTSPMLGRILNKILKTHTKE